MPIDHEKALSPEALDAFLARRETGVLSLARGDDPYAIPISFGYDGDRRRFYFRLVSTPDSEKRAFLSSAPEARFVAYDRHDDVYRSVIAVGPLEEIAPADLTVEHVEQYGDAKRPLFEIWGQDKPDLDIKLYKLDPTELSGRETLVDRESDDAA